MLSKVLERMNRVCHCPIERLVGGTDCCLKVVQMLRVVKHIIKLAESRIRVIEKQATAILPRVLASLTTNLCLICSVQSTTTATNMSFPH